MSSRLQIFSYFLTFGFLAALGCALYFGIYKETEEIARFKIQKPSDHHVFFDDPNGDIKPFKYIVFTDPQLGLRDAVDGNDGTAWDKDLEAINLFGTLVGNLEPDFVVCAGDLNNAYPQLNKMDDAVGFRPLYRPPQTLDIMRSFESALANDIPSFFLAGNHDLYENPTADLVDAYEKVWGQTYYSFWRHGHLFVVVETQYFRSTDENTLPLMNEQLTWLEKTMTSTDRAKTVVQHVPLFIQRADETDSEFFGKAIPMEYRMQLIDIYCRNNVGVVISGHTHFTHFPEEHVCENGHTIKQVILTSIAAQLDWTAEDGTHFPLGKPGPGTAEFLQVNVNDDGITFQTIEL